MDGSIYRMIMRISYFCYSVGIYGASLAILSVIIELELKKRSSQTTLPRKLIRELITCCSMCRLYCNLFGKYRCRKDSSHSSARNGRRSGRRRRYDYLKCNSKIVKKQFTYHRSLSSNKLKFLLK